ALVTAARLVAAEPPGSNRYALVVGADVYSRIINPADRRTAVLFGDGAGAVVLGPVAPGHGLIGAHLSSQGSSSDLIRARAGGSRLPASEKTVADGLHFFEMNGRAVREFVMTELPRAVTRLLADTGVAGCEVDHFFPHQANGVLLGEALPRLN